MAWSMLMEPLRACAPQSANRYVQGSRSSLHSSQHEGDAVLLKQ